MSKLKLAVHKFSSCDGCQLSLLNLGQDLIELASRVEIVHFAEAGPLAEHAPVDLSLVEGSICAPGDVDRIKQVRQNSRILVTIGACATSGGLQALRNQQNIKPWVERIYGTDEHIQALNESKPISKYVKVDHEVWGCPVNSRQILELTQQLLMDIKPRILNEKICLQCKRDGNPCVMVTSGQPCMGTVTRAGCRALCPSQGRACYACHGPAEHINLTGLKDRFGQLGQSERDIRASVMHINSQAYLIHD